jgi:hypothetical protein
MSHTRLRRHGLNVLACSYSILLKLSVFSISLEVFLNIFSLSVYTFLLVSNAFHLRFFDCDEYSYVLYLLFSYSFQKRFNISVCLITTPHQQFSVLLLPLSVISSIPIRLSILKPLFICVTLRILHSYGATPWYLITGVSFFIILHRSEVRVPVGAGNFSLHHRVQNGSGAHPASYPMATGGSFPGPWSWPRTSV